MPGTVGQITLPHTVSLVLLVATCSGVEAEVINANNLVTCGKYFYQDTPPSFSTGLGSPKAICQTYNNRRYFATLFSTVHKIPVYSAYRGEGMSHSSNTDRNKQWHNEPQLEHASGDKNMIRIGKKDQGMYTHQLTDLTYDSQPKRNNRVVFHKGHLNPVNHHNDQLSVDATFTHTNAVPQDGSFNSGKWKNEVETTVKTNLLSKCNFQGARKYIVTGTVPSRNRAIGPSGNEVVVPSHLWSAVCCDTSDATFPNHQTEGWSQGYLGDNTQTGTVQAMKVAQLNTELGRLYGGSVEIFADYTVRPGMKRNRPIRPNGGQLPTQNRAVKKAKVATGGAQGTRYGPGTRHTMAGSARPAVKNCDFNGKGP